MNKNWILHYLCTYFFIVIFILFLQIVSLRWYLWGARGKLTNNNASSDYHANSVNKIGKWTIGCVLLLHSTQIGVLWRYFKLFIPVNLTYVKHEVHVFSRKISNPRQKTC